MERTFRYDPLPLGQRRRRFQLGYDLVTLAGGQGRASSHRTRIKPKTISKARLAMFDRSSDLSRNKPTILVAPMAR
jgi:hypothetical protein